MRNVAGLALAAVLSALLPSSAFAGYILFGEGYVASPSDTYLPADAGACCIGEGTNITNVYLAQTFIATGEKPNELLLGLSNNSYPIAPFQFRILFTEYTPGFHPGDVLWESKDLAIDASVGGYNEYAFKISGLKLDVGTQYAWILDTYVTRDGVSDTGGYFANIGGGAPGYAGGALYMGNATGSGRTADFASAWVNTGFDASFLISYKVPEPAMLGLVVVGLAGLAGWRRRKL
jgi:hypothetical protein